MSVTRLVISLAISVFLSTGAFAQVGNVTSTGSRPIPGVGKQPPYPTPISPQEANGGYWRMDHSFEPILIITNVLEQISLPVTPSLYASDGTEYNLPDITLAAAGVAIVDIPASIAAAPAEIRQHFSDYGSAGVRYQWHWAGGITTMIQNRDAKRSLNFNFDLHTSGGMPHGTDSTTIEGLWWKEDPGVRGFLGLVNLSAHALNVKVEISSETGKGQEEKLIVISPNETKTLDILRTVSGQAGGIRVSYNGTEKDLAIAGGLENPIEGYSAKIPFTTVEASAKPALISISGVGMMLGKQNAALKFPTGTEFGVYLDARNTTSEPIILSTKLFYMDGGGARTKVLQDLTLEPHQSKHWSPKEFASELSVDGQPEAINLVFSYQGVPSDLVLASGAIDGSKTYVSESHLRQVAKSQGTILNDWDVSDGNDTLIGILNLDEDKEDLAVTFFFDGGSYKLPVHLPLGGSAVLNLRSIILNQQPDVDGKTIPLDALRGTAILSGSEGYAETIQVAASSSVLNVSTATCGNKCPTCFGYSGFQVGIGDPFCSDGSTDDFCPLELVGQFKSLALGQNGVWMDVSAMTSTVTWSSSVPGIASSQGRGAFLGQKLGAYTGTANANLIEINGDCAGTGSPCPTDPWTGSGSGQVSPTILFGGAGGTDITGQTKSVVAGQQIQLYGSYTLPSGGTLTGQSWTISGTGANPPTVISNFVVASPPLTSGPVPLTTSQLSQQSVTFYYVASAASQQVTFTLNYKVNGTAQPSATAQTTFNVSGPTSAQIQLIASGTPQFLNNGTTSAIIELGDPTGTSGIQWSGSATSPTQAAGTYGWAQTIANNSFSYKVGTTTTPCAGPTGLDNQFPLPLTTGTFTDSPDRPLPSNNSEFTWSWDATTFFIWNPGLTNSIWVPIAQREWKFFADATQNLSTNIWTIQSNSSSFIGAPQIGYFPIQWNGVAKNGSMNGCP